MALRHLKIPITEAPPLLRGLVQHVLSPCRYSVAINQLDCLQALRDKTLYVRPMGERDSESNRSGAKILNLTKSVT